MKIKLRWDYIPHQHLLLIDSSKFEISKYKDSLVFDSSEMDDTLYIQTIRRVIAEDPRCNLGLSNTIDMIREHDLVMMQQIKVAGFNIPNWYYNTDSLIGYIQQLDWDKKYMLKCFNQARSMGKKVVDIMLLKKMSTAKVKDYIEFNQQFDIDVGCINEETEQAITYNRIIANQYYLMDFIDIDKEYRVVYIEGMQDYDLVIEERFGYGPNSEHDRKHIQCDHCLPKTFKKKLINFCKKLGKFTMSIDVYVDHDGNYGLLEYSTQYGIEYDKETLMHMKSFYNAALLKRYNSISLTNRH